MSNAIITQNKPNLTVAADPIFMAVNRYLLEVKRDKPLSTYKTYAGKMKFFATWMSHNPFDLYHDPREVLKTFRTDVRDKNISVSSKNLTLSVVRSFFKSLLEKGVITIDPSAVLKNFKESKTLKKSALSKEQIHTILDELNNDTSINSQRNRALFILLTMNGLRISEASNLRVEDFGMEQGRRVAYLLRKGYSERDNFVVLQDKTYQVLMDLIGDRTEGAVFTSYRTGKAMSGKDLSRIVKTLFRRAGIDSKKISAHSLRHSFSILALTGGATLLSLSRSLNHANLATTQSYVGSFDRIKNSAEDAVNLAF